MSGYNEQMVAELKAQGSFTFEEATKFAEERGLKVRSVIAKIKSLGLQYTPKPTRVTKTGAPVVLKSALVAEIEQLVGIKLASLEKVTKEDLEKLVAALGGKAV